MGGEGEGAGVLDMNDREEEGANDAVATAGDPTEDEAWFKVGLECAVWECDVACGGKGTFDSVFDGGAAGEEEDEGLGREDAIKCRCAEE